MKALVVADETSEWRRLKAPVLDSVADRCSRARVSLPPLRALTRCAPACRRSPSRRAAPAGSDLERNQNSLTQNP